MASNLFVDDQHEQRFVEGRAVSRRGGILAPLCGARTRNGGTCRHAPLVGHNRCLRHAGAKAARANRQRQFDAMQAGKISHAEFARSEAKRAANRLRDQWKKDPWVNGSTIDLRDHEMGFQGELLHWNGARQLAPAVLDWLRWRFRRLQIDRAQNEEWALVLRDELPRRVRAAGDPPSGWDARGEVSAAWKVEDSYVSRKRARPDSRRVAPAAEPALRTVTNTHVLDPVEVARIVSATSTMLRPLLSACATQRERDQLVSALVVYTQAPNDRNARDTWLEAVAVLRRR